MVGLCSHVTRSLGGGRRGSAGLPIGVFRPGCPERKWGSNCLGLLLQFRGGLRAGNEIIKWCGKIDTSLPACEAELIVNK